MNQLTVNMLKDGNRTVVIINGSTPERDELAYRVLQAYSLPEKEAYALLETLPPVQEDAPVQKDSVEGLEPIPNKEVALPKTDTMEPYSPAATPQTSKDVISSGTYAGMDAASALRKGKEVALLELYKLSMKMTACAEKTAIVIACKKYMQNLPNEVANIQGKVRMCNFLRTVEKMHDLSPLMASYGFRNINDLERFASDSTIEEAVQTVALALSERGKR